MDVSMTLFNAHIHFLDTQLALIHIPLCHYKTFLQDILQLLFKPACPGSDDSASTDGSNPAQPQEQWAHHLSFVNISLTPVECSVVCPRAQADELFAATRNTLDPQSRDMVSISTENYLVIQVVGGEGFDPSQRVLDLTRPLAMADIPIFFITTYFSDYILVPEEARSKVITVLRGQDFKFHNIEQSYVNPEAKSRARTDSSSSSFDSSSSWSSGTPMQSIVDELQSHTFSLLKDKRINFNVNRAIELVQFSGSKEEDPSTRHANGGASHGGRDKSSTDIIAGLMKCLVESPCSSFLSVTLTDNDPASILLEKRLSRHFAPGSLLEKFDNILVPITWDLATLPMESTGIVFGVAGRLVDGTKQQVLAAHGAEDVAVEMSFLSTARAVTVLVEGSQLDSALEALKSGG